MATPDNVSPAPGTEGGNKNALDNANAPGDGEFRKQLEAERTARVQRDKQYAELRTAYGRQTQELGQLRARVQPDTYADPNVEYEEPAQRKPNGQFRQNRDEGAAFQSSLDGFQLDLMRTSSKFPNSQWQPYYDKAVEFIKDPLNAEQVAVFDANGLVDYRKTLRSALKEIQLQEMYEAREKSQAKRNELDTTNEDSKRRAIVSGGGATDMDQTVDIENMSPADMVKAGLITVDKNDPPSFARRTMNSMIK
jgi:hypothetical protein